MLRSISSRGSSPRIEPYEITLAWARKVDLDLRSTLVNPPHGRADLALTFTKNLTKLDALRDYPNIFET